MNFCSLIIFYLISLFGIQDKQFVEFKANEVKVITNQEIITVTIPFNIQEYYHIQSEKVADNNFIPTEIHFENPEGFKVLGYKFSKVQRDKLVLDELECEVLSGRLEVAIQLEKMSAKPLHLKGHLYYQACDDRQCFYPRNLYFNIKLSL